MSLRVKIGVDKSKFPEMGVAGFPTPIKDVKLKRTDRDDYIGYSTECRNRDLSGVQDANNKISFTADKTEVEFNFVREISKTYTFMGMEIDSDFQAVITVPSGKVIVAPMYDSAEIEKSIGVILSGESDGVKRGVKNRMNSISVDDARTIVTAMKTGALYDIRKKSSERRAGNDLNPRFEIGASDVVGLADIIPERETASEYSSVILSLINMKEQKTLADFGDSTDGLRKYNGYVVAAFIYYWKTVVDKYNRVCTALCCMDSWSFLNKNLLGDGEYNSRISQCTSISDNVTGEVDPFNVFSFSGISDGGDLGDVNVIREVARDSMLQIAKLLCGNSTNESVRIDMACASNINEKGIEDIFSLSASELQALSVLDSLNYIDEDAELVKKSYDMSDPDERALYVKSAIKSYENCFRDFKASDSYDVTDGIAETVEDIDSENGKYIDALGNKVHVSDITTGKTISAQDSSVYEFKKDLLKVLRLLSKSLQRVEKGFV